MKPSLPTNPVLWRKARIATLVWLWLLPVTALARTADGGMGFAPYPLALVYPSPRLLVLLAAIAWQVWKLAKPPPQTTVFFYGQSHDITEYMRLFGAAASGWVLYTGLYGGLFENLHFLLHTLGLPPFIEVWAWEFIMYALTLGPVLLAVTADHTAVDTVRRTVTRISFWPRHLRFDELRGLGEIRVHGAGVDTWLALFPVKGSPWKLLHVGPKELPAALEEAARATGLPVAMVTRYPDDFRAPPASS